MKASASSSRYNGAQKVVEEPGLWAPRLHEQSCWVSPLKCQAEDSELIGSQLLNTVTPGLVGNSVPLSESYPIQALPTRCSE